MFAPRIQKPGPKAIVKTAPPSRAPARPARPLNGWDTKARSPQQIGSLMRGVIQRKCASGAGACGGTCASCEDKESGRLQRKLTIGSSNDPLEHEADRVAEQVLGNGTVSDFGTTPLNVQRHSPTDSQQSEYAPPSVGRTLATPGRPLDAPIRRDMETRFGHDFSQVRVHQGGAAEQSARDVGALAYTVGRDIVFGAGQFAPSSGEGRRLLAHELTHTIQQGAGSEYVAGVIQRTNGGADAGAAAPKPKCPATHTIPDDVYAAIGVAWGKSKHGEAAVEEHGGRIVTDKAGKKQIYTGSGGSGSMQFPAEKEGDTSIGTFHTHPYSASEGSHLGVAFSSADVVGIVSGKWGNVEYVGAGSCYFVLDTLNVAEREGCKAEDLVKRWDDAFAKGGASPQAMVENAVTATIHGCGLCFYKACQPNAQSAVPKSAQLI